MKRIIPSLLLPLLLAFLPCREGQAQSILRYNYQENGTTHISTDAASVNAGRAGTLQVRLEYLRFSDDSEGFLLHTRFQGKKDLEIPKGTKMTVTLPGNKTVRLEQVGSGEKNRAQYLAEPFDVLRMTDGVLHLDIQTGWNPDDYIKITFSGDPLGNVLREQYQVIDANRGKTPELRGEILGVSQGSLSTRYVAKPQVANGNVMAYNVGMTYLKYRQGGEDFDLSLQLGSESRHIIPYGAEVLFRLGDGSQLTLTQHGDGVNRVVLYPGVAQIRDMIEKGIVSLSLRTDKGTVQDTFKDDSLAKTINQLYQLMMSVSER